MAVTLTTRNTLLGALAARTGTSHMAAVAATVVFGTLFLTVCSRISIPLQPVPINLQTLGVAMLAAAFGWRIGLATVALYIVEGLAGLPVFTFGGGPGYVLSPTFGFIIGFLPMAAIIGWAADRGASRNLPTLFVACVIGDAVAFTLGFAWLATVLGLAQGAGPFAMAGTAFVHGVQPFVVWDVIKMLFAAVTVTGAFALVTREG